MKMKDIRVGEEYAYFAYATSDPIRVRVLETGVQQTKWVNYRHVLSGKPDAVVMEYVGREGDRYTVSGRKIVRTWAEQVPLSEERKRESDRQRATQEDRKLRWEEAVAALHIAGLSVNKDRWRDYLPLSLEQTESLVALLNGQAVPR